MNLHSDSVITLIQALQLVGLMPCLLVVFFLLSLAPRNRQVVVPIFYFASLACGFVLPLLDIFIEPGGYRRLVGALLFGESVLVAFSFLLILQFMMDRVPPLPYWLVLALPLIGGGAMVYAVATQGAEACLKPDTCLDLQSVRTLYNIFASAMVFLLLVYYSSRFQGLLNDLHKRHKYWLIVSLILLHLLVLAVELARLAGHLTVPEGQFIETVFRLAFIYLVLTSLFRVFYPTLAAQMMHTPINRYDPNQDLPHVETVRRLLDGEHVYRQMRLNRAALAKKVGIGEHHLSRVINWHFGKTFNELVNSYRIEEATRRLRNETTQITTIAYEVGFNSIASFNRVFKEKIGVSPTEYRMINSRL